jgi:hypothetical protein
MRLEELRLRYPGATPVFIDDPPIAARVIAPPVAAASAPAASKPAALALPSVAAVPAKPAVTKAAPKRVPFAKALETVCGGPAGLGRPWSHPANDKPTQPSTDAPKPNRWDRALRNVCGSTGPWSMPDEHAR